MSMFVRSKKRGERYEAQFQVGCYWFSVQKRGRVVTYPTAAAARAAAAEARPFQKRAA